MKTLLIVDGHSLAHRGHHAVSARLTAPDGTPTSTIVGFMNMLYRAQDESLPDATIAVFDAKGKTFRHELYADYKAERKPLDDDLRIQIDILKELLPLCGIKTFALEGVEADDVAASAAKIARNEGWRVVILSSDKDLFQLLCDGVRIIRPVKGGVTHAETYTEELFIAEYHFHPASMPDYLAITGDKSDNVKGVDGIGEIGAKKLLSKYPTIEAIYASLDEIPKSTRAKLKSAGEESVIWTRDNLTLLRDNLFDGDTDFMNDCMNWKMDFDGAEKLALRLGLSRVLQRIGSRKLPTPREFYHHAGTLTPDCDIITEDYKLELCIKPEKFSHSPKVFDIHTAIYLLHPDEAAKRFAEIKFHLSRSETPPNAFSNLAGNLNAEMSKYDGLHSVMTGIDLPIIPVLNRMEAHGIRIKPEIFASVQAELSQRISEIEAQILDITGLLINLNSSSQVSWLLFDKLNFPVSTIKRNSKAYSTEAGVLERLAKLPGGQVPALILEYRALSKMLTSFVIPLQKASGNDGIIHTTFDPAMTGTGRLSSREPNVQNLPVFGQWAAKIKSGLIPVNPENVFVSADYSQVELRVLAHMSQEERLIDAFTQGRDIHTETASWVFGVMPELVTPEMRRAAKMINFGLIYGMGAFGLSERLDISRTEAKEIMTRYFDALPGIQSFIDGLINDAKERGYSLTLAGRIRPVSEIPVKSSALDRALINSPIQGTAADIARKAVISFDAAGTAELFLQVHDSLVCECPMSRAGDAAESLCKIMAESGGEISILKAESKTGKTLADV